MAKLCCYGFQAGRSNGFTAGVQLRPHGPLSKPLQYMQSKDMSQMSHDIAEHLSYAVAYSPLPSASYAGGELHAYTDVHYPLTCCALCRPFHDTTSIFWIRASNYLQSRFGMLHVVRCYIAVSSC